jgi:hypothetical protein
LKIFSTPICSLWDEIYGPVKKNCFFVLGFVKIWFFSGWWGWVLGCFCCVEFFWELSVLSPSR